MSQKKKTIWTTIGGRLWYRFAVPTGPVVALRTLVQLRLLIEIEDERSHQGGEFPRRNRCTRAGPGLEGKCLGGEQQGPENPAAQASRRHINHGAVQAHHRCHVQVRYGATSTANR